MAGSSSLRTLQQQLKNSPKVNKLQQQLQATFNQELTALRANRKAFIEDAARFRKEPMVYMRNTLKESEAMLQWLRNMTGGEMVGVLQKYSRTEFQGFTWWKLPETQLYAHIKSRMIAYAESKAINGESALGLALLAVAKGEAALSQVPVAMAKAFIRFQVKLEFLKQTKDLTGHDLPANPVDAARTLMNSDFRTMVLDLLNNTLRELIPNTMREKFEEGLAKFSASIEECCFGPDRATPSSKQDLNSHIGRLITDFFPLLEDGFRKELAEMYSGLIQNLSGDELKISKGLEEVMIRFSETMQNRVALGIVSENLFKDPSDHAAGLLAKLPQAPTVAPQPTTTHNPNKPH